ncbi:CDP-glycerol:poly(glycerophosphate) glycerophosphotransferase [Paraliobacillus sp. PM-2]|nr:CDP-glycerol:poly(glycerophosphate) glycerophosphotransferase [Paraliobacillus sp. PM-2]
MLKKAIKKAMKSRHIKELYKYLFFLIGLLPVKKNVIIFESFLGKQYSDNPRALYEYMIAHNYQKSFKMYWSINGKDIQKVQNYDITIIKRLSLKWLWLMPRAKYWIVNSRLPIWIPKPKNTVYLQTWHGTPLKKLALDMKEVHMPGTNTEKYKANFLYESRKWDYLISPNRYSTNIFKRAFQFDKEMIESGYPRNDYLYNNNNDNYISQLKEKLGLDKDKKIILYAPTWRDNSFYGKGRYKFDLELDLSLMKEKLGNDYIILLRMHYLVAEHLDLSECESFIYDFSKYEDIRDLYLVSDILVTDYSSVFFDYANLRRPMLFFVHDIDNYRDNLRGFYFDFETEAPGPLVKTTQELINEIVAMEDGQFSKVQYLDNFREKFCKLEDGNASKRVIDKIIK